MKRIALISSLGILFIGGLSAQEIPKVSFNVGAGFTQPIGATGRRLDTGWNLQGGVGYNFMPRLGAMLQFDYNSMGINSATLNSFDVPGGNVKLWSLTVNPIVHLNPGGHVDFYIIGGGGLYHRTQEFTAPTVDVITAFDPWFGFYPVAVPANQILASYSVMKPGVNIGGGFAVGTRWRAKFYAEARYHRMMFRETHTDYIPVNFGFRW
jgi:opacity protein-like surface antigen